MGRRCPIHLGREASQARRSKGEKKFCRPLRRCTNTVPYTMYHTRMSSFRPFLYEDCSGCEAQVAMQVDRR
jgi:hypothetical protein